MPYKIRTETKCGEWKITQAALDELEKTTQWKKFARGYGKVRGRAVRPADIYGPQGMLDGWDISFKTPGDLWEVLARNMGGGMPPEVPKTLVTLCGPRVELIRNPKGVEEKGDRHTPDQNNKHHDR